MQIFDLVNINTVLTPVPSSFNNGLSLYEDISKLIYLLNELIKNVNGNTQEEIQLKAKYEELLNKVTQFQQELDSFKDGSSIANGSITLEKLANNVMEELNSYIQKYMYNMHNFVSFGLDGDYFVAYIPETWKDINFTTSVDGNLILEF